MKTFNHTFTGYDELEEFLGTHQIVDSESLLIQFFDGMLHIQNTLELLEYLSHRLSQAHIIGTSTDGEIIDANVQDNSVILSFTLFESTSLSSIVIDLEGGSMKAGKALALEANRFGAQAIIVFTNPFETNGDLLMHGFSEHAQNIILAGGMAGDNGQFRSAYVISGSNVYEKKAVAVMMRGNQLRVNNGYSFHWLPIGPKFTVTRSVENRIYTLDNKPILDVYRDYLGDSVADTLPSVGVAFPIVFEIEGKLIGRAPLIEFEDGALGFGGSVPEGIQVQFGIGNANLILEASRETFNACLTQSPESIFVYSCMARRRFLGDSIGLETTPLHMIAPVSGFFTYGEFFTDRKSGQSSLFNETMSFLILSESDIQPLPLKDSDSAPSNEWSLITFGALSHLVSKTTSELQTLNGALQQRIENQIRDSRTKDEIMIAQSRMAIMGEMIGMIAHQWRQPITVIGMVTNNGILDIQLGDINTNRMLDDLTLIDKQVHFLSQTIDDFRNFFRPNKLPQHFSFNDIKNEILTIMGKSFENHNIEVVFSGEMNISVQTYKNELLQVFLNIFSNSRDAFEEQNAEESTIICNCEDRDEKILFLIKDNAGGIPESIITRIFEPYFSTKGEKNGTGLGLYMSSIIIEKHLKGNIRVCSNDGVTTFAIQIPKVLHEEVLNVL